MVKRIRLAIQKKGRLGILIPSFLEKAGLDFEIRERQLICSCANFPLDLLLIRHRDIIPFIESKQADLGIVGSDVYLESGSHLKKLMDLGFAKSTLTIAVPRKSTITQLSDLNGKVIATTFPRLVKQFFKKQKLRIKVVTLSGSVEVAPELDMAQAIADLVGSGTTLRMHGLRPLIEILHSEAVLVAHPELAKKHPVVMNELCLRLQSVRDAKKQKYVLFNLPEKNISTVRKIFPGLAGPSIIKVEAKKPMVAVHVVVAADLVWQKIVELRAIGATGILVIAIDNLLL